MLLYQVKINLSSVVNGLLFLVFTYHSPAGLGHKCRVACRCNAMHKPPWHFLFWGPQVSGNDPSPPEARYSLRDSLWGLSEYSNSPTCVKFTKRIVVCPRIINIESPKRTELTTVRTLCETRLLAS